MSRRSLTSIILALLLIVGTAAPFSVQGRTLFDETTGEQYVSAPSSSAGDTQPLNDSAFGRALSAPFRAIGKLFGGGSKNKKTEAAKKETVRDENATSAAAAAVAATTVNTPAVVEKKEKPEKQKSKRNAAPHDVEAAKNNHNQPTEATRIVRPGATGELTTPQSMFIPIIEGIGKDPLSQGRALLEHGYLNEAIAELSVAASIGPELVEANNLLGLAYDRRGWHTQAAEAYGRALSISPRDGVVLSNYGYSLYLNNNYRDALKRLKQADRLIPNTPTVLNSLGIVQASVGKYDDAFKNFTRVGGEYDAHLKLAEVLSDRGRDNDAIKHYEAALRIQPDASAILERLMALYARTGRQMDAAAARRTLGQPKNPQKTTTGGGG